MADAVTQTVRIETAAGVSVTVVGAITITAGDLMSAAVSCFTASPISAIVASDSRNGAYAGHTARGSVANVGVRLLDFKNSAGGLTDLTAGGPAGTAGVVGVFREISGADKVAPFDKESGFTGTSSALDTGDLGNTDADSIYVAVMGNTDPANPITYAINAPGTEGTWIENDATNCKELNGASFPAMGTVTQVVSVRAPISHVWTTINTAGCAAVAIYRAAGPNITVQPAQQTVLQGLTATFNITATGTGVLHYQWTQNGSNVGTDTNNYTTPATVDSDTLSTIQCTVTDDVGTILSDSTYLVVIQSEVDWLHTA